MLCLLETAKVCHQARSLTHDSYSRPRFSLQASKQRVGVLSHEIECWTGPSSRATLNSEQRLTPGRRSSKGLKSAMAANSPRGNSLALRPQVSLTPNPKRLRVRERWRVEPSPAPPAKMPPYLCISQEKKKQQLRDWSQLHFCLHLGHIFCFS